MKTKRFSAFLLTLVLLVTVFSGVLMSAPVAPVSAKQLMGDLDASGALSTSDAYKLLQNVVKTNTMTDTQKVLGDLNGDGKYTTTDVRMVLLNVVQDAPHDPVRAFWLTYYEVETLYSSGVPATVRSKIDALFDELVSLGTNTVYFHVRANSDAYYDSAVFNSYSATATLVSKGFDPFAYAVTSAHARGLRIEAWFNPYRIGLDKDGTRKKCDSWFSRTNATTGVVTYYYIPSSEGAKNLIVSGVEEVVKNYDIDGVHFDDYFYPTDLMSPSVESFESADYNAFKNAGGTLSIADWRRMHVSDLVARVYKVAHSREDCVFGISPAGDHNKTYNSMYGDVYSWLKYPGYIDYMAPQLYFGYNNTNSPFTRMQNEWEELPRHASLSMIAGLAFYKTGLNSDTWAGNGKTEWANNNNIISRQVNQTKAIDWDGAAFFSYSSMTDFTDRNATVAKADMSSACSAWLIFR